MSIEQETPGGGGTRYILEWGGAADPQTLTLFKTKIVRFLIPCLRHLAQNYTLFKKLPRKDTCLGQSDKNRYPV